MCATTVEKKTASEHAAESPTVGNIIVVDDNPNNLKLLDSMLRGTGLQLRLFPRAELALRSAKSAPPDLFLLDINMPQMDGYELCRVLKADPVLAETPVIFLSALNDTSDKVAAFDAGGVDYVTKPFQIEEVRKRIETHLEIRRQRRLLESSYERLKELEELRDNLVHMIVHDMRTPLTIIQSGLDLVSRSDGEHLSEKGTRWLTNAKLRTSELIEMVSSLLDISKFESGKMKLATTQCDLAELVRRAATGFEAVPTHRIILSLPQQRVAVQGDPGLLNRVIQNLIGNAVKYAPQGTEIQLTLEGSADTATVAILDQGPGIPAEHRERIFDKFFQLGEAKNSSGLGLAFCKLVIDAHGGRIAADNLDGRGSKFWFSLPVAAADPSDRQYGS